MDAFTISAVIAAVLIAAVCAYLFKAATRETPFEEAYGHTARKLLTEDKTQKSKSKPTKAKKMTTKPTEKQKTSIEKHENQDLDMEEPAHSSHTDVSRETKTVEEKSTNVPVLDRQHESPKESAPAKPEDNVEVKPKSDDAAAKKSKKKHRPRKAETDNDAGFSMESHGDKGDEFVEIQEKPQQKAHAPLQIQEPKLVEKTVVQTTQRHTTVKKEVDEITMADVINKIKSLNAVEPEYVTFLTHYGELANFKEAKLEDNINALQKESEGKERMLKQTNNELKNYRLENEKLKSNLKDQYDKYETFESTVRSKLSEIIQLKDENKRLHTVIAEEQRKSAQYQHMIRDVEVMRSELNKKSSVANEEVTATKAKIEQLAAENAELSKAYRATKSSYETELGRLQSEIQKMNDQHLKEQQFADNQIMELSKEVERAFGLYNEANKNQGQQQDQAQKLKDEKEKLLQESQKLSSQMEQLNAKCHHLEQELEHKNSNSGELMNRINQLTSELQEFRNSRNTSEQHIADLKSQKQNLEEQNAAFARQLDINQKKLLDFEEWYKANSGDKAKLHELQQKNQELEAEIQNLKSQISSSSATNHVENNVSGLSHELQEQKRRNQELRDANYKLLESIHAQEQTTKKLLADAEAKKESERREFVNSVMEKISRILPQQAKVPVLNSNYSVDGLSSWIEKNINSLAHLTKQNDAPAAFIASNTIPAKATKSGQNAGENEETQKLRQTVQHYEKSLKQVKSQLNQLHKVAEEVDREQKAEITRLTALVEKSKLGNLAKVEGLYSPDDFIVPSENVRNEEVKSSASEEWEVVGSE